MRQTTAGPHYTIKYSKEEQVEIEDYLKQNGIDIVKAAESLYERTRATIHYFCLLQSDKFVSDMQHLVCQRRRLF
jgi:hypothetical protein